MSSKKINNLIKDSYKDGILDKNKVNEIACLISRSDLKKYINGLKLKEKKKNLIISSPNLNQELKKFAELFPNKKIILKKDSSLMLGVKVVDNDLIYEFTLKNTLNKILDYVEQNYD